MRSRLLKYHQNIQYSDSYITCIQIDPPNTKNTFRTIFIYYKLNPNCLNFDSLNYKS